MIKPQHFLWRVEGKVGVLTLNRPEKKNPLTFESYAELRQLFGELQQESTVKAVVLTGAGGHFCTSPLTDSSRWPSLAATCTRSSVR